jgi:hypothetical protein
LALVFGSTTRALPTVYFATGLRPSELRLAFMEDLNLHRWTIYVRSPKGAGVWAENRTVTIMPPYREEVVSSSRSAIACYCITAGRRPPT